MRTHLTLSVVFAGSLGLSLFGCGGSSAPTPSPSPVAKSESHDSHATDEHSHKDGEKAHTHSHDRGTMLIADVGKYHALLTAHLSKDGNELEIFFETPVDKDPQSVALSLASFEAQATSGDGDSQTLTFEPAPADERPKDEPEGKCSHFSAKAAWMKPEDKLVVVARFTIDGEELTARWNDFSPKKYAHHHE